MVRAGAVQLESPVWAPYQVPATPPFQISQQVPSDDRSAKVMLPPGPPGPPVDGPGWLGPRATLTVEAFELGPATKVTDGSEAESSLGEREPYPPDWMAAASAVVSPVDSACLACMLSASATPGALATRELDVLFECRVDPSSSATNSAVAPRLSTVAIIEKPSSLPGCSCPIRSPWSTRPLPRRVHSIPSIIGGSGVLT